MAPDHGFGFDFAEMDSMNALGLELGYLPRFEKKVLKDEGSTSIVIDEYGVRKRIKNSGSGMPQFLSFPVNDRASWESLLPRLNPDTEGRFPADWHARIATLRSVDIPVGFGTGHLCGFFSFLRELCGDGVYYLLFDDPDLIREMLSYQADRLAKLLRKAASETRIDRLFIWEDMAFKNGPLIGPVQFRDFLMEPYSILIGAARESGVPIIDVDSDGDMHLLIDLWLEAGVTMLHPFEVAAGMDVVEISRRYGKRLALRGGVDKRALARGRTAIDAELERIRPAFDAGGYIPHVDHSVPPDVSFDDYRYYLDGLRRLLGF